MQFTWHVKLVLKKILELSLKQQSSLKVNRIMSLYKATNEPMKYFNVFFKLQVGFTLSFLLFFTKKTIWQIMVLNDDGMELVLWHCGT